MGKCWEAQITAMDLAVEWAIPLTDLPPAGMGNGLGLVQVLIPKIILGLANGLFPMVAIFSHPLLAITLPLA